MSKRALEKHLNSLNKDHISLLVTELYEKFPEVKTYFNFVFNPNEEKIIEQARVKIANEYFPLKRKRPKARRSMAQKYIKHFETLGVAPELIASFMWFNLGLMYTFSEDKPQGLAFFKSFLSSYKQAVQFVNYHQLVSEFKLDILKIYEASQAWPNAYDFEKCINMIDD
jgi:hypothetical protein